MGYILIPYNWKEYIYHRGSSFSIQSNLSSGLIPGGNESHKGRQTIFFTPLNPFGGDPEEEEEPRDDHTVLQKVHSHSQWKLNQDAFSLVNFPEHKIKDCNFGKHSHMRSSGTILYQQSASAKQSLRTEIEYCSEDSPLHDLRQKSH